ncbi:MAG: peptidyl-prolyl cis-trans isomerase [Novosphingobium sp.]
MLQSFRSFFESRWGVAITLGFLALIAFAFAGGDVANSGALGSFGSGDIVATVGKEKISSSEVESNTGTILSRMRQNDPTVTMTTFLSRNGLEDLLGFLIDRKASRLYGEQHGIHIGDRLIDSEISKIPGIQGPDGKVDPAKYRQFVAGRGQTDAQFRAEVAEDLMGRQLVGSSNIGIIVPQKVTMRYANVVTEQRKGIIITLPAASFAPKTPPGETEVNKWYTDHKSDYALPERRTVRYIAFGDTVLKNVPVPTEAEVAARYNATKAKYAPTDKRKLSQLVLPTEAAAKVVLGEVGAGKSLEASAAPKGLAVAPIPALTKEEFALQASAEASSAVFAAPKGKVLGPFKAPLGWLLIRVDGTEGGAGKTLDQARPEIAKELGDEKRREAIAEFSARIEEDLGNGATLTDVAKDMGLEIKETPLLLVDGTVYGKPEVTAPTELAPVLQAAFAMDSEKQPQLTEVDPGKSFVIFDVGKLIPAAPPPLNEIRTQVIADVQLSKGAKAAKTAAENLQKQIEKGVPPEIAVASLGVSLPPIDRVDKPRQQVQAQGQNASQPEKLVFTMAKGKVRLLSAPRNRGWYVVTVTEVTPGNVTKDDQRLPPLQADIEKSYSGEYGQQLGGAMRQSVGSTRNEAKVGQLKKRLSGTGQ